MVKLHLPLQQWVSRTLLVRQKCVQNPHHWGSLPSPHRISSKQRTKVFLKNQCSLSCTGFPALLLWMTLYISAKTTVVALMAAIKILRRWELLLVGACRPPCLCTANPSRCFFWMFLTLLHFNSIPRLLNRPVPMPAFAQILQRWTFKEWGNTPSSPHLGEEAMLRFVSTPFKRFYGLTWSIWWKTQLENKYAVPWQQEYSLRDSLTGVWQQSTSQPQAWKLSSPFRMPVKHIDFFFFFFFYYSR